VIGLEAGFIFLYRAGWKVSTGPLVANAIVSLGMIVIGLLFYKESLSIKQIIGIALCMGGLVLVNT
jgi:multidrug transporter EmrE-like cation transporter